MNDETLSRGEALLLQWACAVTVLLRLILIFRYRFDSDEPQHMHVAWAWARGLMQYRDVFDNHMPLFHILSAPLFRAVGETANVLYLARIAMLPLFLASLVLLFAIADRLFDRRTALWATLLAAVCPPFFLGSLEYRTDDLWIVFWFACVALLVTSMSPMIKMLLAGFALGFAFGVSMKSLLFVAAIATAVVFTAVLLRGRWRERPSPRQVALRVAVFTGSTLAVPSLVALYFVREKAWQAFAYCVLWHNESAPFDQWWRVFWVLPMVPAALWLARRYAMAVGEERTIRRRLFVFLLTAAYFIFLSAFWPVLSFESYLPFYPLAVVLATPAILRLRAPGTAIPHLPAPAHAILALAIILTAVVGRVWRDDAEDQVTLIRQVLQVTRPADPVMDLKGETLFRRRPYWLVLESITHRKLRHRMLRDDIAAALIRSGTAVLASDAFPPSTQRFVRRNYVPWGRLWVLGRPVRAKGVSTIPLPFRVVVPSTYVVVGGSGCVPASIDGRRVNGGIDLKPGWHTLLLDDPVAQPMVIWSGVLRSPQIAARLEESRARMSRRGDLPVVAGE